MGTILLFYKYVNIEYPKRILKWQRKICTDLGLKGRILLGEEGINGTVGGETHNIERYKTLMLSHELFHDTDLKESPGSADDFPRMQITIKKEIVNLGIDPKKLTSEHGGIHLKPKETHELIASQNKDLVILDARNDFEWEIGAFEGAIKPDIRTFRDFPNYIDKHADEFANKEILMYCTGGIRCERASTYVKEKTQAKNVYQMEGGIHRYAEKFPDGYFRGKNYVFDKRVTVKITDDIISTCSLCNIKSDDYTNCVNVECNKQYICCHTCFDQYHNTCSQKCKDLILANAVQIRTTAIGTHARSAKN